MLVDHKPAQGPFEVAAFSLTFRLVALSVTVACVYWFAYLIATGQLKGNTDWSLMGMCIFILIAFAWAIWRSVVRVGDSSIEQTWLGTKRVAYRDIVFARLFRLRGLEWLVAPRLYLRCTGLRITAIYSADERALHEFLRIENAVRAMNNLPARSA